MTKYNIELKRPECIGCGACTAVSSEFWEMADDGKSNIKGGTKKGDDMELEIEEKDLETNKEAAESCPVNVIHITDIEKGEKII